MNKILFFFDVIGSGIFYIIDALRFYIFKSFYSRDFVFKGKINNVIHILGNGPSLKDSLDIIKEGDDIAMVNFSPLTDIFFKYKPEMLILSDMFFFIKSEDKSLEEKKKKLFHNLNKRVNWPLIIIMPSHYKRNFRGVIINEFVKLKFVNKISLRFSFHSKWVFLLYKKNLALPPVLNVIIMSIYVAIQLGYKNIYLHGVDSDSYKYISLNKKNEMILNDIHFYGKTEVNLKNTDGENFAAGSLFKLLDSESKKFKSYTELAKYASSIGVNVINASPNSMIDSFDRL